MEAKYFKNINLDDLKKGLKSLEDEAKFFGMECDSNEYRYFVATNPDYLAEIAEAEMLDDVDYMRDVLLVYGNISRDDNGIQYFINEDGSLDFVDDSVGLYSASELEENFTEITDLLK